MLGQGGAADRTSADRTSVVASGKRRVDTLRHEGRDYDGRDEADGKTECDAEHEHEGIELVLREILLYDDLQNRRHLLLGLREAICRGHMERREKRERHVC